MCQHCGCRNTGFDYTQKFNADDNSFDIEPKSGSEGKYTLVRWMENLGTYQFRPHGSMGFSPTSNKTAKDMVNYLQSEIRTDGIGRSTSLEHGIKFSSLSEADKGQYSENGNGNGNGGNLGDGGPAPGTEESETDMGMVGFAIAGGAILIAAFLFGRR
ncbi:MAG TPA: hypothetical protein DCM40_20410 [Maribacter sp.]|nr:hypothetical protein [Maribacter sp.]